MPPRKVRMTFQILLYMTVIVYQQFAASASADVKSISFIQQRFCTDSTNFNTEGGHQYLSIILKTFINIYSSYRHVRDRLLDLANKNLRCLGKLKFQT